ncbi:MAG: PhnB protein [Azoarcus sp.]|uniref:PhnB protein n=1 Tax=Aromatoleum tolulyticum TaxID=34027 RepID=A0A1N6YRU1_9RHOO|nr:VOC family protein [Aromatoleum tolulyticum]MCK9988747.1 PhnB protein [Azoarcus sp.]SIR17343.1 PhnB protein [Aromatoleum tolulyticum]
MQVQPYLFFDGRCDEAIAFYREVLGAEVTMLMRFRESPDPPPPGTLPPGFEEKVMHANLSFGDTQVMVSDGPCTGQPGFQGFALTASLSDVGEVERVFGALAEGGQVQMPLEKTFWSPRFGMLTDRFGVSWMVMAMPEE